MKGEDAIQTCDERDAVIAELREQLAAQQEQLTAQKRQIDELTELLSRNSTNSHLPPSSDGPGAGKRLTERLRKLKSPGKRKRGGQKGRKGVSRARLDPSNVDVVRDFFPVACCGCAAMLPEVNDGDPRRTQQVDIVGFRPQLTEFRRHAVACPACGKTTLAEFDPQRIPSHAFGPRLTAIVVMLTGVYHLSRARVRMLIQDLFGISICIGTISAMEARTSKGLADVHEEIREVVEQAAVKYADATTWLRDGKTCSVLTICSAMATYYAVLKNGSRELAKPLFGAITGILVSDRAAQFNFWLMTMRPICWAHLLRKFVSFSERDGPAGRFGQGLLDCTALLFAYWRAFKSGELSRTELIAWMRPVQRQFELLLRRAVVARIKGLSGSCQNMFAHREALWTFVTHEGVEPTNNEAERELRPLVLWRKTSFGSKSARGDQFVARVMSVARTARKQGRRIIDFFEATLRAGLTGAPAPRLTSPA